MAYTTINKSTDYFNTKLYTGNGSTNTAQTGVGFQPDWTWIKERSSTSSHIITDAVRGANKSLSSNLSSAESTETQSLISFDADGFTVGSGGGVNENSQTYASWNWLANGAGSSNTDGTLTSTVSANTTSGFSIVKYTSDGTGTTIGHGLGKVPDAILLKNLTGPENWVGNFSAIHPASGNGNNMYLNLTNADQADIQTVTARDATTFTCANFGDPANDTGTSNYIAYCFNNVQGFSKMGSYIGNGNANGSFIYTGFKPAFIITRNVTSAVNWGMFDNKRNEYNVVQNVLLPDNSASETTGTEKYFDFLSNGFKVKNDSLQYNGNNEKHIFMAFAEAPLVGSNNVPANAR